MAVSRQPKGFSEVQHPSWTILQISETFTTPQHCQPPCIKRLSGSYWEAASGPCPRVPVPQEGPPSGPLSTLAWNHWLDEVRRSYGDCRLWASCPNQAPQEEVAQGCVQSVFKYLHRWRPHKPSVKPIPVFDHQKKIKYSTWLTCGDIQPSPNLFFHHALEIR